ncbi:MAG: GTP cyclohydrolase I FolE [Thermotogae bacterium]|nr:GTP cyclohydrolase I FolE [Thermotogota bacterium]
MNRDRIAHLIRELLIEIGEDPDREGLRETPRRIARMYEEIFAGYSQDPKEIIGSAIFHEPYDEMVVVKDIDFYSMCEHHMLPFFGVVHVAYIPKDKVVGLSKIPRIVDAFARRLQIQEKMTVQIAQTLQELLDPLGVAVIVEATHLCSVMRGVKKPKNRMITSAMLGIFRKDIRTRNEFLQIIGKGTT